MICDKCPQVILFQYFREWAAFPKLTCARLSDTLLWVPAVFCRVRRSNEAEKTEVTSGEAQVTIKILPKSRTGNCAWYSQASRLSDKLGRRENEPSENTTHVIWRIGRWLLSPQSPRAQASIFTILAHYFLGAWNRISPNSLPFPRSSELLAWSSNDHDFSSELHVPQRITCLGLSVNASVRTTFISVNRTDHT